MIPVTQALQFPTVLKTVSYVNLTPRAYTILSFANNGCIFSEERYNVPHAKALTCTFKVTP